MKKSQRARLATLTAQSSRTAEEEQEFATLTALAVEHADPALDTADEAAAPRTLVGSLTAALSIVRSKAATGADLAQARAELTTARSRIAELETAAAQAAQQLTAAQAQLAIAAHYFGLKPEALAQTPPAALATLLDERISALAIDQLTAAGVPAANLPTPSTADAVETLAEVQAQLARERDPIKAGKLAAKANQLRDQQWGSGRN